MKIVIAGSSGFVGSELASFFKEKGYEVIRLSRSSKDPLSYWDPEEEKINLEALEGADVVINCCGENIFGRWTQDKIERIKKSRFVPTRFLVESILKLKKRPELFINASAVGFYGDRGSDTLTEEKVAGKEILPEICEEWEKIPERLSKENIRVVFTRFGVVLGRGGALKKMQGPFKVGLGGKLGSGNQYMSWIAIDDLLQAMDHVILHKELSGPINFTSPMPVTNAEFTKTMSRVLKTPALLDMPSWAISLIFGKGKEMFLSSTRAIPKKLLDSGYTFKYSDLESALKKYLKY